MASWGETLARLVDQRIARPQTNSAAITALKAKDRFDGMLVVDKATGAVWTFKSSSTSTAGLDVLAPDAGDGRWHRASASAASGGANVINCVNRSSGALAAYTRTANVILADAVGALGAQDGVTNAAGDLFYLSPDDAAAAADAGVYVIDAIGAAGAKYQMTRAPGADTAAELPGLIITVEQGTTYKDTAYQITNDAGLTLNTTAITDQVIPFGFGLVGSMTASTAGGSNSAGTSNLAAHVDHKHGAATGTPVATGAVNAAGAVGTFSDSGHVHAEHINEVRYVMTTDVPNLAAFVVTQDGVVGIEGDFVLLANQTAPAENGVYVLGVVAGTAPLTRAAWMPAAAVLRGGHTVHVEEGTLFASTSWFISTAGAITVGTTAHAWYPESVTQSVVLVAGTATIATVPVLSATRTGFTLTRRIANTCVATDGGYCVTTGGANGVTAGAVGAAAVIIEACVLAGTINNADVSTLNFTITNR